MAGRSLVCCSIPHADQPFRVRSILTHSEKYQLEIVKSEGLPPLLRLLHSTYLPLILSSAACVRNVSIHPSNESPIIDSGFLQPLIDLLSFEENEEVQCHAISTLRNLAASSEKNKGEIVNAGAVERIRDLVLSVPVGVQSEMTACVAVLALSGASLRPPIISVSKADFILVFHSSADDLKPQLLELGICEVLIPLTNSPSVEVQGNSAAAIGNLSSKAADDYNAFNKVWNRPEGGLHTYLVRFLGSSDMTFQHIAVWTLVQLLESEGACSRALSCIAQILTSPLSTCLSFSTDEQLYKNIKSSPLLLPLIRQLASARSGSRPSSPTANGAGSDGAPSESGGEGENGADEIASLSLRILDLTEDDDAQEGDAQASGESGLGLHGTN